MCARLIPKRLRSTVPTRQLFDRVDAAFAVVAPAGNAINHGSSHTREAKPSRKKERCQPNATTKEAISGAPNASPARVPQVTTPEAKPRSLAGGSTLTNLQPPGSSMHPPTP